MTSTKIINARKRIKKIGGALYSDYLRFYEIVGTINRDYFPLFELMGFNSPENTDVAICILLGDDFLYEARYKYIAREMDRIKSGEINIEKILHKRTIDREYSTPEEKESVFNKEIQRALHFKYNKIEGEYCKFHDPVLTSFHKSVLTICGRALTMTNNGFIIDDDKFLNIYGDYLEANGSQTGKMHQEIASSINRFFNGQIKITEKEFFKYFVIEHGEIKPNPNSINMEDYMRLGIRGKEEKM